MKLVISAASFLGGLIVCYLLLSMGALRGMAGLPTAPNDVSQTVSIYLSFVGVMLTAVTVVLAALAIGIGKIAAYTFSGLKTEARAAAQSTAKDVSEITAKEVASDALSEIKIKAMFEDYRAVWIREKESEKEWGSDSSDAEER